MLRVVALANFVLLLAGCNVNPFNLAGSGDGGAGDGDGGGQRFDAGPIFDAGPPPDADNSDVDAGCVPETEICDGQDNDCDDAVDEETNLNEDPANCGACGIRCALPGAQGSCSSATCSFVCSANAVDLNGDLNMPNSDGCEYGCLPTNGGVEACDLTDNDCDGLTDEDFGVDDDVNNCGGCGNVCNILNAVEECVAGECTFTDCVELVPGEQAFADVFPNVPGCEYQCPVTPPLDFELCNNVDDDCDGIVDEDAQGGTLGNACTAPGFEAIGDTGECSFGTIVCTAGSEVCSGYVGPEPEVCDGTGADEDCDGNIDNGFDTNNSVSNCGVGCVTCSFPNAIAECQAGVCGIADCQAGFHDINGDPADGCEYPCTPTGPEVCNGRDDDCDDLVDLDDPDMQGPPPGLCREVAGSPCTGITPICVAAAAGCPNEGVVAWRCDYPATSEDDECFRLPVQESRCDGIDGNCDGVADEIFLQTQQLGQTCDNFEVGVTEGPCVRSGQFECTVDGTGTECVLPDQTYFPPDDEVACDNIDDDCDGTIDEAAPDSMVGIDSDGDTNIDFFIDAYEASRPDAEVGDAGSVESYVCSNPDVTPWTGLTWTEADLACASAGKRLCTAAEWQVACEGLGGTTYPYGNAYDPNACNGNDYDPDCGADPVDEDLLMDTGFDYTCPLPDPLVATCEQSEWAALAGNDFGTFDMSGNAKEWTAEAAGAGARQIRGGAYDSTAAGMTCQFDFVSASEDFFFPNLGFRCCADATP